MSAVERFYTTIVRDSRGARKVGYLLGPFETETRAREHIPAARREAERIDPFTAFDAFGTCVVRGEGRFPVGALNERCGVI